jgi:hypothetical protein
MAYDATATEHAGPMRGEGAYWGTKRMAKEASRRLRRLHDRITTSVCFGCGDPLPRPGRCADCLEEPTT